MPNFQPKQGFTLIETVLSLFVIVALVTIIFAVSGSYSTSRNSNLQGLAAKIASRESESVRQGGFATLASLPTTFNDSDLAKLTGATTSQTAVDACSPPANPCKIKLVTVQVNWTQAATTKSTKIETLIYENGLP